jgi:hypothetical protein
MQDENGGGSGVRHPGAGMDGIQAAAPNEYRLREMFPNRSLKRIASVCSAVSTEAHAVEMLSMDSPTDDEGDFCFHFCSEL